MRQGAFVNEAFIYGCLTIIPRIDQWDLFVVLKLALSLYHYIKPKSFLSLSPAG